MNPSASRVESLLAAAVELESDEARRALLDRECAGDDALKRRVEQMVDAYLGAGSFLERPAAAAVTGDLVTAPPESPAELSVARELFLHMVVNLPPEGWGEYLRGACGGNPALEQQVNHLLQVHRESDPPSAVPAAPAGRAVIGRYKLLQQLGEGGMGTVWMAEQTEPVRRLVALKLIRAGMDSAQVVARFEAERQALALMDHPNIAGVLDAGTTEQGQPYFVMELVKGVPITKFCDDNRLTPDERLRLMVSVCQAIQHAHTKGVIHRDIKPSNVLIALYDGKPVPKVIDFGLAKATGQRLTDKTMFTAFGAVVGTPEYMSPEQAELNQLDIDTRSDVYSLGVLLYELLTGTTPVTRQRARSVAILEVLRIIREEDVPLPSARLSSTRELPGIAERRGTEPSRLSRMMRGELDWIVMKALDKDRNRRYETAGGLAADLLRHLRDEPVLACPPSALYRIGKFSRRHRAALAMAVVLLCATLAMAGGAGWVLHDRAEQRNEKDRRLEQALGEGEDLLKRKQRPAARAAIVTARELLPRRGKEAQKARAETLAADLAMAERLEAIRLGHAETPDTTLNNERSERKYAQAFRDYGLDIDRADPEEAARHIRSRPVVEELRAALDDWAVVRWGLLLSGRPRWKEVRWRHPLAIARAADDDPSRNRIRDALSGNDRGALKEIAAALLRGGERDPALPAELAVFLAEALEWAGDRDSGTAILLRERERNTGDLWLNFNLGMLLDRRGQPGRAARYLAAAQGLRPQTGGVYLALGTALCRAGERDEGIAAFRKAIALDPGFAAAHNNLGNHLVEKGDLFGALHHLRKAAELDRDNPAPHLNLGVVLGLDLGELDAAVACVSPPPTRLAAFGFLLARKQQSLVSSTRAIEIQSDLGVAYYNRGACLADLGRTEEAIADLTRAVRYDPAFGLASLKLGDALMKAGKFAEAEAVYRQAAEAQAKPARGRASLRGMEARARPVRPGEVPYALGRALVRQKKAAEAEAAFREAAVLSLRASGFPEIEVLNDLNDSWHALGEVLLERKKYAEAEDAFRDSIAACLRAAEVPATASRARHMRHDLGRGYDALGRALAAQKKDAEDAFRQAIRYLPDERAAGVYSRLGGVLFGKGRIPEAEEVFLKALSLDERHANAHQGLGLVRGSQGRHSEAIRHFKVTLAVEPDYPNAAVSLGVSLLNDGAFDEALVWLKKGLARMAAEDPTRPYVAGQLRNCKNLVALSALMPAVDRGEHEFVGVAERANMARVFYLKKRYGTAARLYEESLAQSQGLADDWNLGVRFAAACAAARAGGRWQKQALAWLRDDLALGQRILQDKPEAASAVARRMKLWRDENALAGVREPAALAKLPPAERRSFAELWDEVEVLHLRATRMASRL